MQSAILALCRQVVVAAILQIDETLPQQPRARTTETIAMDASGGAGVSKRSRRHAKVLSAPHSKEFEFHDGFFLQVSRPGADCARLIVTVDAKDGPQTHDGVGVTACGIDIGNIKPIREL